MAKWALVATACAGAVLGAGSPTRAEEVGVEALRIVLDSAGRKPPKLPKTEGKKPRSSYGREWKRACEALGQALSAGKGPYGFGAFGSISCYRGAKNVGGPEEPTKWVLTVLDGDSEVRLTLTHQDAGGATPVASVTLPASPSTLQFLQDDEFADLVAFSLLDAAPMGLLVAKSGLKGEPPAFTGRYWRAGQAKAFKFTVPAPPENLVLYRLRWDEGARAWRSQVVGTAKKGRVSEPKKKKGTKKEGTVLVGGSVEYVTSAEVSAAAAKGTLWAHDADGPGTHTQELQAALKDAQLGSEAAASNGKLDDFMKGKTDLLSDLLGVAASGYLGLRYGLEVVPGTGELGKLLNKTHMFGLLFEMRGGPLSGLRYYYDLLPKTSATLAGATGPVTTSIGFSRHVLGYSFEVDPGLLVDRLTLTPKLGMWTFNATLPTAVDAAGNVQQVNSFNLGRTFNLALELGVEELSSWYTLRAYYALNTGFSLIRSGGKITSNTFGIDAYFTAGPTMPLFGVAFKTALLAFYRFESVSISNGNVAAPAPGQETISGITYDAGYAGGGIAISW